MTAVFFQQDSLTGLLVALGAAAVLGVVFLALLAFGFWFVWKRRAREGRAWAEAAKALGFELGSAAHVVLSSLVDTTTVAQPMSGVYGGRRAAVWTSRERFTSRTTNSRRYVYSTCASVAYNRSPVFPFSVQTGRLLDFVVGGGSFEIGYPPFDSKFRVEGTARQEIIGMLARRSADGVTTAEQFVRLSAYGWELAADRNAVIARRKGVVTDESEIRACLNILNDLAARIDGC